MTRSRLLALAVPAIVTLAPAALDAAPIDRGCSQTGPVNAVYPGNSTWSADIRGSATVAITGANPRNGTGSLALTTSGDLFDWGFYLRAAPGGSYGLLAQLDCLGFDWFRETVPNVVSDVPWLAQSPVLRLFVADNGVESQLVWEKYYSDGSPTVNDGWHSENLIGQNFWRVIPGQGYTIANCAAADPFFPNPLLLNSVSGWASGACFSSNAFVTAISVGVGSSWPDMYRGFVDNVQLGFGDQQIYAVNDNFELTPVPEPGTIVLMATGLAVTAGAGLIRRRRRVQPGS